MVTANLQIKHQTQTAHNHRAIHIFEAGLNDLQVRRQVHPRGQVYIIIQLSSLLIAVEQPIVNNTRQLV